MKRKNIIITAAIIAALTTGLFIYKGNTLKQENPEASPTPSATTGLTTNSPKPADVTATPKVVENYKAETVNDLKVTFKIPEEWKKVAGYDNRYEGKSGFAQLSAISGYGLTLKETVDLQINHELKPFGDKPQIKNITIDSQEASIIIPTDNSTNNGLSAQYAILVKYPKPVTISATPYNYLIIWADKDHVENIANEIKFVK